MDDNQPELPPALRARIEAQLAAADEAVKLFSGQRGFARIRIRLAEQAERLAAIAHLEFGSEARAKVVLKWFDTQARTFLPLVRSQELFKAYEDVGSGGGAKQEGESEENRTKTPCKAV
jgi:hypothetical protein